MNTSASLQSLPVISSVSHESTQSVATDKGRSQLLRDRILCTARSERQRCLASAGLGPPLPQMSTTAVQTETLVMSMAAQTDPVTVIDSPESVATWSTADDNAQAEALQTLRLLGEVQRPSIAPSSVDEELRNARAHVDRLEAQLAQERQRTEAAQQQVLCLEAELDRAEAVLQESDRALLKREGELQLTKHQLQEATGSLRLTSSPSAASIRSFTSTGLDGCLPVVGIPARAAEVESARRCLDSSRVFQSRSGPGSHRAPITIADQRQLSHPEMDRNDPEVVRTLQALLQQPKGAAPLDLKECAEPASDPSESPGSRRSTCALSSPSSSVYATSSVYAPEARR